MGNDEQGNAERRRATEEARHDLEEELANELADAIVAKISEQLASQAAEIERLQSELTALRVEVANHFCDVRKIREWLPTHKPAVMAFTSGPEREVADLIEQVRAELAAERGRWDFLNTELLAGRTYPITPEDGNRLNSLTPADAAEFLRELVDRLIQAKEQADG